VFNLTEKTVVASQITVRLRRTVLFKRLSGLVLNLTEKNCSGVSNYRSSTKNGVIYTFGGWGLNLTFVYEEVTHQTVVTLVGW